MNVITQPTNQTISGVVPAQQGNISGTSMAPTGSINGVSSSPSGTNYNPQPSVPPVQPAAGVQAVMPNTTSAQAVNQTPTQDSQTFKLGDGSVYNSTGQQVAPPSTTPAASGSSGYSSTPTGASVAGGPTNLNTPLPGTTTPSTSLTNDTGYSDIQKMLSNNLNNMDKLFANMSQYATVSPEEQVQQGKVANDSAAMTSLGYQEQGLYNPGDQTIALPFLTGQAKNQLVGAGIKSTLDQSVLNYMQGNRQFAFNSASTIFNASQQQLQTTLDAYAKIAPQNLSTNYNPTTGAVNAFMRNPLTGETYTAPLGNIGAQKSFTSTNIQTDPLTGALTFVGTTSDGQVITQPISGNGSGGVSITNPLQGSNAGGYTQTSQPSAATSTVGGLLSNWTSGGTTAPGAGYQSAVYQTISQLTGQKVDASTPTSTLISNIPALAQGIAKAEGYGQPNNVGTRINNPGNILWANQPNAVPYTSSNGYTYAKFNTEQDGYNAMNTLLAKKLGASPATPPVSPSLQQVVGTLPPALQGAVRHLSDGTPYFNANQLTAAQVPMAQSQATRTGIPYVNGDDANKLDNISVALQNLNDLNTFVQGNNNNSNLLFGKIGNFIMNGPINTALGSNKEAKINEYRQLAIDSLKALVGGSGSGLRITAGEIVSQQDNIPNWLDTPGQAQTKADALSAQLNKWTAQILPNWKPSNSSNSNTPDFTATLNNLMSSYSPQ